MPPVASRACRDCGCALRHSHAGDRCDPCTLNRRSGMPRLPLSAWDSEGLQYAVKSQDMGRVIAAWRRHRAHGADRVSQLRLAELVGVSQGQLSKIESGGHDLNNRLDLLRSWARVLGMPPHLSWFGPIDDYSGTESTAARPADSVEDVD